MIDLDTRARAAASGLRHAVDDFAAVDTHARPEPRGRRPFVIALVALVVVAIVVAGVVALRDDTSGVRTVDQVPSGPLVGTDVGGHAYSIAVDPRGVFVANQGTEVIRLDRQTGAIATRVPTERRTYQVVTDPKLGIWAFGGGDGADSTGDLVFLGPSTLRPPTTIHLDHGASALALTAGRVWVLDSAGNLSARDPRTMEVTFQAAVFGTDNGGWLTVVDGHLWIATSKVLYEYDPGSHAVGPIDFSSVTVGGDASFTAVASDGHWLWDSSCTDALRRDCFLERRDPKTGALLASVRNQPLAELYGGPTGAAPGIVGADGSVWAIAADGPSLIRTTRAGGVERVMTIPAQLRSDGSSQSFRYFTVGAGALWYSVPGVGKDLVYRIPLP
ncbi:MAG: hypothetical protein ACXWAY_04635 [Acidimicrobiia bacterium]